MYSFKASFSSGVYLSLGSEDAVNDGVSQGVSSGNLRGKSLPGVPSEVKGHKEEVAELF